MTSLKITTIALVLSAVVVAAQSTQYLIRYMPNPALPRDMVMVAQDYALPLNGFFTAKPERRPADVPVTCVLVQVMRVEGQGNLRLLGWAYLDADYVNALHGILPVETVAMQTL
jgi:hypothetical protein